MGWDARKSKESDRKRGVVFQEKHNKAEKGEVWRRDKRGWDNEGGIEKHWAPLCCKSLQSDQCERRTYSLAYKKFAVWTHKLHPQGLQGKDAFSVLN